MSVTFFSGFSTAMLLTARGRARARCSPVVALLALLACASPALGSSEGDADASGSDTQSPGAERGSSASVAPARLLSSVAEKDTGLRVDRYVKPLGSLRPGEVLNTDPTSDAGKLARPVSNETDPSPMLVARVSFDLVHGETLEPLPLDRLYNHHLVIFSRPAINGTKARKRGNAAGDETGDETGVTTGVLASLLVNPRDNPSASAAVAEVAANLSAANLSAVLAPCGVGAFFAGGGAEWRGIRDEEDAKKAASPSGDAAWFDGARAWIDPPAATWGANVHVIDLRGVRSVRDSVQCNCAAYAERTPGTPQRPDHSPQQGGGVACCGDGARGPLREPDDKNDDDAVPVALLYEIAWTPLSDALTFFAKKNVSKKFPKTIQTLLRGAPKTATLMVSSSPDLDGASCAGEYDARPCASAFVSEEERDSRSNEEREASAWRARANSETKPAHPRDQKCADVNLVSGETRMVSVATSHVFRLPPGAAYDVSRVVGHQHVGGFGVRLLNVTGREVTEETERKGSDDVSGPVPYLDAPSVCSSLPTYGKTKGAPGDEAGFLVAMSECVFDPPLRLESGEAFVVQSVYGADKNNYAPAAFPPPYEGVMGYVTLTFTVPPGFETGVFSRSGERKLLKLDAAKEASEKGVSSEYGTCVATPTFETASRLDSDDSDSDSDEKDEKQNVSSQSALEKKKPEKKSILLTPAGSNPALKMAWRFVPGEERKSEELVQITLTLTETRAAYSRVSVSDENNHASPTWMALGVHRPGGHGMPGADMVVASSADGGETFAFDEMYTDAYDAPRPRGFYGEDAFVLKRSGCAVRVSPGVNANTTTQSVTFERLATVPSSEAGATVADVKRGRATDVVWAFGEFGRARMTYHARRAGTSTVTW